MEGNEHEVKGEKGGVTICNVSDDFYWCCFETRQEVDEFIHKLEQARDYAFERR